MKLHESGENYLKAILILTKQKGYARSCDLAQYLHISKPSVSRAVKLLHQGGFLTLDSGKTLRLTELGQETAENVYERHRVLKQSLISIGVDPESAEQDACRIEHDISKTTFDVLKRNLELRLASPAGRMLGEAQANA